MNNSNNFVSVDTLLLAILNIMFLVAALHGHWF